VKAVYFAWISERIGRAEEELSLSAEVSAVVELLDWEGQGDGYAFAFERAAVVCAAIDRRHVGLFASIGGALEIAFFAPMTGG
jgi:sulfur-carrier protein